MTSLYDSLLKDEMRRLYILDIGVGADDVLDLVWIRVLEGEAAGSDEHPLSVLHPEAVHDRENLPFQLDHLNTTEEHSSHHMHWHYRGLNPAK